MSSPQTIPEALLATAERGAGEYVFHLEERVVRLSCAELAERAERGARHLRSLGVEPGDSVGVLGPNRPEWVVAAFATWMAGAVLVPLQRRLRVRDPAAFSEQLRLLLEVVDCRRVLVDPDLLALLPAEVATDWTEEGAGSSHELSSPPNPADPAVIQFTSGSTSVSRGALIEHAAVMAQTQILDEVIRTAGGYRTSLSWAPYFHDLGLFLNVLPAAVWGMRSHHLPTERFARDPAEWLRLIETTRASLTFAPSSSFGNALRAVRRRGERVDLSTLEAAFFAAEGVDPAVVEQLAEAAPQLDLRLEALGSSYGMAETVLAVAMSAPGTGLRLDTISIDLLASDNVAVAAGSAEASRMMVGCGTPKMDLRIAGPEGDLPDRHVGEILLRGSSLMRHYVGFGAPDPFVDGWLHTGDLGYMADGQLYVTGRIKDMVIVMGDNYYPEDFEWAAGRVEGVRSGRCVAFSVPEADEVVLVVEPRDGVDSRELKRSVRNAVADAVGIAPSEVVVLPPGAVPKTTSGKLRRAAMREAHASGTLDAVVL